MDASSFFKDRRITVMGLGLLGRGVGDIRYLASCGAKLTVTDLKTREQLAPSLAALEAFPDITYVLGEHRLEDFRDRDLILKAAGVPLDSPYVVEAQRNEIPVRMSADLFAELSSAPVIGVTGTRGKSTTTHLIHSILKEAGKKVLLGGNVRGVSTLALLPEVTSEHVAVLELDSWQCQGFGDAKMSPHIAVFTTFFPDHLNYYQNNLDRYLADKANIFLYQKPSDTLVLGSQCAPTITEKYGDYIASNVVIADAAKLPKEWMLKIPGEHNRYDAALALLAARTYGVDDEVSRRAIEAFGGVPGRLELCFERGGVRFYNDTTATTPEATIAALKALTEQPPKAKAPPRKPILIMGGADKSLDMDALLFALPGITKRVVLLSGTGTDRIRPMVPSAPLYGSLAEAVADAWSNAEPGDAILFSPAFASFGMFKNEYDRGDQFNAIVRTYGA